MRTPTEERAAGKPLAPTRWRVFSLTGWLRAVATAYSVPAGTPPLRACTDCGRRLFSSAGPGVTLSGTCAGCGARRGPAPWVVEVALTAAIAAVILGPRPGGELPAYLWFTGLGVVLAVIDAQVHRLPNPLTLAWAGGVLAGLGLPAITDQHGDDWVRAGLAATIVALLFAAVALIRPGSLGWGDVKAALGAGAALGWLGWAALYAGMFLAFALASVYAVVLLRRGARRASKVAFGPFLVAGAVLVVAWWPAVTG